LSFWKKSNQWREREKMPLIEATMFFLGALVVGCGATFKKRF
jgi:hypothetical protein